MRPAAARPRRPHRRNGRAHHAVLREYTNNVLCSEIDHRNLDGQSRPRVLIGAKKSGTLIEQRCRSTTRDPNVADDDKRWQDMSPDEQAVVIHKINGAVNGLQFRVQDLEEAVKALQEGLKKPTP